MTASSVVTSWDELPLVLKVDEAARVLRIGRAQAYEAVRTGEIPSVPFGRSIRIPKHKLAALLGVEAAEAPQNCDGPDVTGAVRETTSPHHQGDSHEQSIQPV